MTSRGGERWVKVVGLQGARLVRAEWESNGLIVKFLLSKSSLLDTAVISKNVIRADGAEWGRLHLRRDRGGVRGLALDNGHLLGSDVLVTHLGVSLVFNLVLWLRSSVGDVRE